MKLYEIDQEIQRLIDDETGEIMDVSAFEALHMERDQKLENMALWYKNLRSEAEAIKKEEETLKERRTTCENKANGLKERLNFFLNGEAFKTSKVAISFRNSESVEVDEDFILWAKFEDETLLKYKDPEPNKTAIKEAIKAGKTFEHARIVQKVNPQIR